MTERRLLNIRDLETLTGLTKSTIYRLIREADFPRPIRVGAQAVRWKPEAIAEWERTRELAA